MGRAIEALYAGFFDGSLVEYLPLRDSISLALTCRSLAVILDAEEFWRDYVERDFKLKEVLRASGWKLFYKMLDNGRVYTWG